MNNYTLPKIQSYTVCHSITPVDTTASNWAASCALVINTTGGVGVRIFSLSLMKSCKSIKNDHEVVLAASIEQKSVSKLCCQKQWWKYHCGWKHRNDNLWIYLPGVDQVNLHYCNSNNAYYNKCWVGQCGVISYNNYNISLFNRLWHHCFGPLIFMLLQSSNFPFC